MSVLGYSQPGNPKSMTQLDATSPQRTYLIRICKEMISSMDLLRVAGLQGLAVETSLATRKYSSSIFCWKTVHNFQEGENKNAKCKLGLQKVGASGKASYPPFYSRGGFHRRTTRDATVIAITSVIMQILHTVTSHVSIQ